MEQQQEKENRNPSENNKSIEDIKSQGAALTGVFLILNIVLGLVGICMITAVIWQVASDSEVFLQGLSLVVYCMIANGGFIFVTSLVGCLAGSSENTKIITIFVVFAVMTLIAEGIVVVVCFNHIQSVESLANQVWIESNQMLKDYIQTQLECCGLHNYTEYAASPNDIKHSSCYLYDQAVDTYYIHQDGCLARMIGWLEANSWMLIITASVIVILQAVSYIVCCKLTKQLVEWEQHLKNLKAKNRRGKWLKAMKKVNKVHVKPKSMTKDSQELKLFPVKSMTAMRTSSKSNPLTLSVSEIHTQTESKQHKTPASSIGLAGVAGAMLVSGRFRRSVQLNNPDKMWD